MSDFDFAASRTKRQYACLQPIDRKPQSVELSIPTVKEILFRWDHTDQFPGEIAKRLRIGRALVDAVLKQQRRKIAA